MIDYTIVPAIAVACFSFLLLSFVAAKKNPTINSFIMVLIYLIFWSGGSYLMRTQFLQTTKIWYDLSLFGIIFATYEFMIFVKNFAEIKRDLIDLILFGASALFMIINTLTGFFLAQPEVVLSPEGKYLFVYNASWPVIFLFLLTGVIIFFIFRLLFIQGDKNNVSHNAFNSLKIGIIVMLLGHVVTVLPFFKGVPTDIFTSIIFVFTLFYSLYRKKLFRLDLLISRWIIYLISVVISLLILMKSIGFIEDLLVENFNFSTENQVMFITVFFTIFAFIFYRALELFINRIYISDDTVRTNILKEFKNNAFSSLKVKEISRLIVNVIKDTLDVKEIYVLLPDDKNEYFHVINTSNPLNRIDFNLELNNPLVMLLNSTRDCILLDDLKKLNAYKSMWTDEKKELSYLNIECFVPLIDDEKLIGILMLTHKTQVIEIHG